MQAFKHRLASLRILQQKGFLYFKLELGRIHSKFVANLKAFICKTRLFQCGTRQIYRNRTNLLALLHPSVDRSACLMKYKLIDAVSLLILLCQRQKHIRGQQPSLRMPPSDESLCTCDALIQNTDFRLIINHKFAGLQCMVYGLGYLALSAGIFLQFAVIKMIASFAGTA